MFVSFLCAAALLAAGTMYASDVAVAVETAEVSDPDAEQVV